MKKVVNVFLVFALCLIMLGCNDQQLARNYGGTAEIHLPVGKKLVNVTWKEGELWYLLRNKKEGEVPERYEFKEDSVGGIWEGTVILIEK
jgi:hypothetical protein